MECGIIYEGYCALQSRDFGRKLDHICTLPQNHNSDVHRCPCGKEWLSVDPETILPSIY
jgi:hypothetical protein